MSGVASRFIWIVFATWTCFAQGQPDPLAVRVDVNLVNVMFIVHDSAGGLIRDLNRDDFEVYEDGVRQDIRFFNRSADLALRLAVLLDMSGSQNKFVKDHHRDLERFVRRSITSQDSALLVCFGNRIRLVSDFTNSPGTLMDALETYEHGARGGFEELDPDGTRREGTALFDAIYATARHKLARVRAERKAILLFSDGEDNSSAHDLIEAIEAAQSADALIYSVRYTDMRHGELGARNRYGIREMERFAAETGGAAFDASKKDVAKSLAQVAEELRSVYELAYSSSNGAPDGTFRKISIRAKRADVQVKARPGYFARP